MSLYTKYARVVTHSYQKCKHTRVSLSPTRNQAVSKKRIFSYYYFLQNQPHISNEIHFLEF